MFERSRAAGARPDRGAVGIVRALDMYELFPFWRGVFESSVVEIVLSDGDLATRALETIPSESICYPAKLAHGHLADLLDRGVERVFMPYVGGVAAEGGVSGGARLSARLGAQRRGPLRRRRPLRITPEIPAVRSSVDPRLPDGRLEQILLDAFSNIFARHRPPRDQRGGRGGGRASR